MEKTKRWRKSGDNQRKGRGISRWSKTEKEKPRKINKASDEYNWERDRKKEKQKANLKRVRVKQNTEKERWGKDCEIKKENRFIKIK